MLKLLFLFMTIPVILCSQLCSLPDCFMQATQIKGYNNGQEIVIESEETQKTIQELLMEALKDSRQMPAYGVSLHNETLKAMQEGVWLEFKYPQTMQAEEMPFDSLLIHVEKDTGGVNLIRGLQGKYDGRCFYLDLENNFNDLYDYLTSLETREILTKPEVELDFQEINEVELEVEEQDGESTNADIPAVPNNKNTQPKVI